MCTRWMNRCKNVCRKKKIKSPSFRFYVILHFHAFKNRAIAGVWAVSTQNTHRETDIFRCICLNWWLVGLIQLFKRCNTGHVNGLSLRTVSIRLFEDRIRFVLLTLPFSVCIQLVSCQLVRVTSTATWSKHTVGILCNCQYSMNETKRYGKMKRTQMPSNWKEKDKSEEKAKKNKKKNNRRR